MSSRGRQGNRDLQRRSMESLERANEVRLRRGTLPNADELRSAAGRAHDSIFSFHGDPGQFCLQANSSMDMLVEGEMRRVTNASHVPAYFSSQDLRAGRSGIPRIEVVNWPTTGLTRREIEASTLSTRRPTPNLFIAAPPWEGRQRPLSVSTMASHRDSFSELEARVLGSSLTGTVGARVSPGYPTTDSTGNGLKEWIKAPPWASTTPKEPIKVEGQAYLMISATWINDEVDGVKVSFLGVQYDDSLFSTEMEKALIKLKEGLCAGIEMCMSLGITSLKTKMSMGTSFKTKAGVRTLRDTFMTPHLKVYGIEVASQVGPRRFKGLYEEEGGHGADRVLGLRGGVVVIAVVPGQNLDFNQVLSDAFFEAREVCTAGVGIGRGELADRSWYVADPGSSETDLPDHNRYRNQLNQNVNRMRDEATAIPGEGPGVGIGNLRAMWAAIGRDMPPTAGGHISEAGRVRYQESVERAVNSLDLATLEVVPTEIRNEIR